MSSVLDFFFLSFQTNAYYSLDFWRLEKKLLYNINYIFPLSLRLEIWKFRVIFIWFQLMKYWSLSDFGLVIKKKQQLFQEGPGRTRTTVNGRLRRYTEKNYNKRIPYTPVVKKVEVFKDNVRYSVYGDKRLPFTVVFVRLRSSYTMTVHGVRLSPYTTFYGSRIYIQ